MSIDALLPFIKEIDRLKTVERQALIHSGGRRENSAEHSWHLAMTVMTFAHLAPDGFDLLKALRMALLHDLVEIDAGDTFVYAESAGKAEAELRAMDRLMSLLPSSVGSPMRDVWLEFERGECIESQFVSAIDRFLPIYSNYLNAGYSWKNHGITRARVIGRCEAPIVAGSPALWRETVRMLDECVERGDLLA